MSDRANRLALGLLGTALLAAGAAGLLAAAGAIDPDEPAAVYQRLADDVEAAPTAWAVGAVLGAVALVALGFGLVHGQLSRRRPDGRLATLTLERGHRGRTTVRAVAVATAVAQDLQRLAGVHGSGARLLSFGARPQMAVHLDVDQDVDLSRLRADAEAVYRRAGAALGVEDLEVDALVRLLSRPPARVI